MAGLRLPGTVLYTRAKPRNAPAHGGYLAVCLELADLPVVVDLYLWPAATAAVPADARILHSLGQPPRSNLAFMPLLDRHRTDDTTGADPDHPATVLLLVQLAAKYLARGDQDRYAAIAARLHLPPGGAPALRHVLDRRVDLAAHRHLTAAVAAVHRLLDHADTASPTAHSPTLVVIRGNSGSGKTTTAREVRRRYGRGAAIIEQDYLRRVVLREHDSSRTNPVAPAFITATTRAALDLGYHVVLEGILHSGRYGSALRQLLDEHHGPRHVYYLDVSFAETARRHHDRADHVGFTTDDMRDWYTPRDLLGVPGEHVIDESATLEEAVTRILSTSGLAMAPPLTPCPQRCPRCAADTQPPDSPAPPYARHGS